MSTPSRWRRTRPTPGDLLNLAGYSAGPGGNGADGSVYQNIPTVPGHHYRIGLAAAAFTDQSQYSQTSYCGDPPEGSTKNLQVRWDGAVIASPSFHTTTDGFDAPAWQHLSYTATADPGAPHHPPRAQERHAQPV